MKLKTLRVATAALALCGTTMLAACSSHEETTTTVTRPDYATESTVTTTTVRTDDEEHHDSVIGATLHAVGTVILFPFRLVGDAISLLV